jgi:hypothetical protein
LISINWPFLKIDNLLMDTFKETELNRIKTWITVLTGSLLIVSAAAADPITVNIPIELSDGDFSAKPKIQRTGDGRLVVVYADYTAGAGNAYDLKGDKERPARDIYVKTCKPAGAVTCNNLADWSAALNLSNSALSSSISTAWQGGDPVVNRLAYPGDIDKPNIKTSGPLMLLTWVSKYCPDGDLATTGIQAPVQRAIKYLERGGRVIPFACLWAAYSTNNGVAWSDPVQLSTGERDAKNDFSRGSINGDSASPSFRKGQAAITWQEDPQGLQIGEAEGPGDGGSGAKVNGGTDVWYAYATVDLSVPGTPDDDFVLMPAARLTDNFEGQFGISGQLNIIFDGTGANVDPDLLEKGRAGASRPNIGMVGSTAIVAYEETKGSVGLDEGKFIRYHAFRFDAVTPSAGCIISNPLKNARRVRFLTQSPADAGPGGIQIGIFWKEGIEDKGGPSDITLRRGMGGLQPSDMVPAVDANCATSDYLTAIGLVNTPAENISSNTPIATAANLADDTEANFTENAMAHRGVLRGDEMWVGYTYTNDLVKLWAQLDNYNFWLRKYTVGSGWDNPVNVTNVTDLNINVREPRLFGTPKSSKTFCPTGDPLDITTTDPTFCQDTSVLYLAWGTQTNVSPFDPVGGEDLGIFITVSRNAAATFEPPVRLSAAAGSLFDDDDIAFESQVLTRPDGTRFYGVWNQTDTITGVTRAQFSSGVPGPDQEAPVITLRGNNPMTVTQFSNFTDPGATVSDNVDMGLSAIVTGSVDTDAQGSYVLSYDVIDSAGNAATTVTRTVTVVEPSQDIFDFGDGGNASSFGLLPLLLAFLLWLMRLFRPVSRTLQDAIATKK